jgi:hypothetical protein
MDNSFMENSPRYELYKNKAKELSSKFANLPWYVAVGVGIDKPGPNITDNLYLHILTKDKQLAELALSSIDLKGYYFKLTESDGIIALNKNA